MGEVSVKHEGGTAFTAESRGHTVRIDQPQDDDGGDSGMTPPELFASALAACVGHYVAKYCARTGIATEGLIVECGWNTEEQPYRIGEINMKVDLPGLPDKRMAAIERVAASCMLHATLEHAPYVTISINQ